MILRRAGLAALAGLAVLISYCVLIAAVDLIRLKTGVGEDTGTPIDVLAWLWCLFAASAVAGNLVVGLLRSAGKASAAGMLIGLGTLLAMQVSETSHPTLERDLFGIWFAWSVLSGIAAGWWLSANRGNKWSPWPAVVVLAAALITLAVVFYPVERYFMSMWSR